jgi:hypothetical protein
MKLDIATLSVIISGSVAIGALIITPITSLLVDFYRWKREMHTKEHNALTDSTVQLVTVLSHFAGDEDETLIITNKKYEAAYADLRLNYFTWERNIWQRAKKNERQEIIDLRATILRSPYTLKEIYMKLIDNILDLDSKVRERI